MKVVVEMPFAGRVGQPAPKTDLDTLMEEKKDTTGLVGDNARGKCHAVK